MNCDKVYQFDSNNIAENPDNYKHELPMLKVKDGDDLILIIKIAKAKTGFVYGYDLKCNSLFSESRHNVPCFYYSLSYISRKRAILAALVDVIKYMSLDVYPIPLITMVGNLFVYYCQSYFSHDAKIG